VGVLLAPLAGSLSHARKARVFHPVGRTFRARIEAKAGLDAAYEKHDRAYRRIFERCGIEYTVVEAHSGAMGGSQSHEFMVASDAGEDFVALSAEYPAGPVRAGIQVNDGFSRLSEDSFLKYFANGVAPRQAKILYAVQEPTAATIFGGRTSEAAWHSKPSFYAVSKQDKTINPDLERFLAKRMHATTVEIDAGHLSLISHPKEVADLILAAAGR